jgi:hypothetical protein
MNLYVLSIIGMVVGLLIIIVCKIIEKLFPWEDHSFKIVLGVLVTFFSFSIFWIFVAP